MVPRRSRGPPIEDDTETAEALLKAGAKVSIADQYGETPLTLACANGNAALVEKFLRRARTPMPRAGTAKRR